MARRIKAPAGWKISLLDSVTKRGSGHTPDKKQPDYWNGGIKWVSLADSHRLDARTISETDKEISELGIAKSSAVVHPSGTVILSRDAGVGKSAVLDGDMAVSQHFIAWRCSPSLGLQNWFLYSWLQFNKREFERQAVGSTIKTIGLPYFKRLQICYPPYAEQSVIVEIIRTWDRAIETVEALIANAHTQKQALMQQLLPQGTTPPKKRLPGFSGVWRETSLGSIGETYGGLIGKSKNDFGSGSPFITYKNVFENGFVDPKNVGLVKVGADERQHLIRNGDILFTTSSETPEEVGMSSVVIFETGAIYLNSFCFGFRPNSASAIRANFAGHFFRSPSMRRLISALAQGSTRYNISKSALLKLAFQLPNADEQDAIADVLGSCDSELLKLTGQLTALRQEKAALMQQLLTGKRRVKLSQSEVA